MRATLLITLLLLANVLAPGSALAAEESLADCYGEARVAAKACRLRVAAVYDALQFAQATRGLQRSSCAFDREFDARQLADLLRDDLLEIQAAHPGLPPYAVIVAALSTSRRCTLSIATTYGGPSTAWLLQTCERGLEDEDEMSACAAHLGATFETLNVTSGTKGADKFICAPKGGVKGKKLLQLLIDEAISDLALQNRPAVEGVARAVSREYPCE